MVVSAQFRRIATIFVCLLLLDVARLAYAGPAFHLSFQGEVQSLNTGSISLSSPSGIVVDSSGNIFIADTVNNQIVEVTSQGTASALSVTGLSPALSSPTGIAIDGSGNLYIADKGNNRIVEIAPTGAGSVIPPGSVTLSSPQGIALDQAGDIFIADTGNNRIVEVPSGGSAVALSIVVASGSATLLTPIGLGVDTSGNLYIADSVNNRIVELAAGSTTGTVVTITGGGTLAAPSDVKVDRVGNIFIADTGNNRIAEVDTSGLGTVLYPDSVGLSGPLAVAVDIFGAVYIADTGNNRGLIVDSMLDGDPVTNFYTSTLNKSAVGFGHIQLGSATGVTLTLSFTTGTSSGLGGVKVLTSGTQSLDFVSGTGTTCSSSTTASAFCSVQITFLPTAPGLRNGAVVLYDQDSNPVLTLPLYGFGDAPVEALAPNTGSVISTGGVALGFPFQIALDGAGNIYVANDGGNLVKISAGGGSASVVSPTGYTFGSEVTGVALDGAGNLFISDHTNNRILVIRSSGATSVLSISGLTTALNHPTGLAFDGAGNLYISDWINGRVVEVSSLKVAGSTSTGIGTVIGTGSYTTSTQGITGVAVDWMGNIYIPDGYNGVDPSRIIKVTAAGAVSLLTPTGITFSQPRGVSVDAMGNIYIADGGNNRIVEITAAGVASVLTVSGLPAPAALGSPFGVTVDPLGNLYIPDSGNDRVLFVNVSGAALTFPNTANGATSAAKTATVTNLGNQPLVFSANPTYTANFSWNPNDTNSCTSATSLSIGTLCDISVDFTPQSVGSLSAGITVTNNTLNVAGSTEQVSVSGTSYSAADTTSVTVAIAPASLASGQTATITASVSDTQVGHTSTIPTGAVTFTDRLGTTVTSLNGGSPANLTSGKATLTGVQLTGIGTHTITANYNGVSGSYTASTASTTVVVSKPLAAVSLASSVNPLLLSNPTTFTATVTSTNGTPTGTVTFLDGTTPLDMGTLSGGVATLTTSSLAAGTHTITAAYSGDSNFLPVSSAALSEVVQDFTLAASGTTTQTVFPGGTANYALTLGPTNGATFPAAITMSLSGLPTGATGTITPQVLAAGSAQSNLTIAIQIPQLTADLHRSPPLSGRIPPLLWGVLLLPFARKLRWISRKLGRTISLLLILAAGLAAMAGLSGCGSTNGFFGQPQQTYTVTVTGTSGALSHSTTVTLTVE